MWHTHLDGLPRAQLVQDIRKMFPALLDSKSYPGKVERGKATRRDPLRRELTGTRVRDDTIPSQRQHLCGQVHTSLDWTIGFILFGRRNLRHDVKLLGNGRVTKAIERLGDDQ